MYLDDRLMSQPVAALQMVAQEIERCGIPSACRCTTFRHRCATAIPNVWTKRPASAAAAGELCQKVTDYLAEMFAAGVLNEDQAPIR
ncbi:MAG: hypothetical protein ACLT98_06380 [Eggerthellaceae bacterium]